MKNETNLWDWMDQPTNAGMIVAGVFSMCIILIVILDGLKEYQNRKGPFDGY